MNKRTNYKDNSESPLINAINSIDASPKINMYNSPDKISPYVNQKSSIANKYLNHSA
jgi:hypothetical protein